MKVEVRPVTEGQTTDPGHGWGHVEDIYDALNKPELILECVVPY